jgi:toxin-antitoxin system PIN domain toxin
VKVVDLNILLYAVNRDAPHHQRAREWWEAVLSGRETVGLSWTVALGFLRISTRPGIFPQPLTPAEALDVVEDWIRQPIVALLHPGERHWAILRKLIEGTGTAGNLTTDAHLAALAIEYAAELCSSDNDFARFRPELSFTNPLAPS